jgi:hypothetical protein
MKIRDHKYYLIKRGINGKLLEVIGVDKKGDMWGIIKEHMGLGYQLTIVQRSVMLTADNLYEERAFIGLPQI